MKTRVLVPILKEGESINIPESFNLVAQPNPFSAETNIHFDLPEPAMVTAEVFDISGKKITVLLNCSLLPGHHTVTWKTEGANGGSLSSGIYFLHFDARMHDKIISKDVKLIYLK